MSEMEKKKVRHDLGEADYHTILFEQDKESPFVWYLTLNRPEKNNAISIGPNEMTGEIKDAMKRAMIPKEVRQKLLEVASIS